MSDQLISREALKEAFKNMINQKFAGYRDFEKLIDNAPTVEPEKAKESEIIKAYTKGFDTGVETVKNERPQGEKMNNDFAIKINIPEEAKQKLIEKLQKEPPKVIIDYNPEVDNFALGYAEGFKEGKKHRPQGEWIVTAEDNDGVHRICCPFCSYEKGSNNTDPIIVTFSNFPKFCENCGANMRKGGAEE